MATVSKARPRPEPQPAESPPSDRLRVALCQASPALGDRQRNLALHEARIGQALAQSADLVVFPELSLTGYYLRDMVPDVALPSDDPLLAALAEKAAPADLVLGFVEEGRGHRFYNSALYAEAGRIAHVHRKVYLPTYGLFDEARYFARGERIRAFDTRRFGRVGLLVCEDFWHLSVITIMQAEGVDLLVCVANSPARGVQTSTIDTAETYQRLCRAYAQLLGAIVVFVNRVGYEDGLCFWGRSMVAGPNGQMLGQGPLLDEGVTVVPIDRDQLRRDRLITPLARDERLLLTLEELNRIKRKRYDD